VPDRGGEGQQSLGDTSGHTGKAATAVQFKVELAFQGVVDRLDELSDGGEQVLSGSRWAVAIGRAQ
jgi:hypothetical protein